MFFFFKQKTAYEMRISDWSSDVCSSDLNLASRASGGASVASVLLRHCAETGADLLVAGGYGHSRLKQWALGGTTRELFETLSIPVLFSQIGRASCRERVCQYV